MLERIREIVKNRDEDQRANQTQDCVDQSYRAPVRHRETAFHGVVWDIRRDTFELDAGGKRQELTREYIAHPGAVAVLALNDRDQVAMVRQYRHPVSTFCWEIPAGLLDVCGESLVAAAQRELAEEAGLEAKDWQILVDHFSTSGASTEGTRIFLAREVAQIPDENRAELHAEEVGMQLHWVDRDRVIQAVLAGEIHNANTIMAVMSYTVGSTQPSWPVRELDDKWLGRSGA